MLSKFIIEKKLLKQLKYSVLIIMILIAAFGIVNIFSATSYNASGVAYYKSAMLQAAWLIAGLIVIYIILVFDYSILSNYSHVFYWICIGLLLFTLTTTSIKGSKNWISIIGDRAIQPSEFAKLAIIILIAKLIDDMEGEINKPKNFFKVLLYIVIPMIITVAESDMGMTMVIFFISLGMLYIAGLNLRVIFGGFFGILLIVSIIWFSGLMPDYQKNRINSFLYPKKTDSLSKNYQKDNSVMAIGSGGIFGDGFLNGTLVHGSRIPESYNDFIFAVVGEEWGLIGTLSLLLLYIILLIKLINIARNSKDIFGKVMCAGIISSLMFSIMQNMGMTIGLLPITGLTLPFFSYGGSSMFTNCIGIGLILNVGMRKKKINF